MILSIPNQPPKENLKEERGCKNPKVIKFQAGRGGGAAETIRRQRQPKKETQSEMMYIPLNLIFFLFQISSIIGQEDHSLQPLIFPSSSKTPNTIPAFPEQSDVMTTNCPMTLPSELFNAISRSCASPISRSRCCPTLSAWLFSAYYSPSSLVPAPTTTPSSSTVDLPVLPDDTETCVGEVEKAMRGRGVVLGEVNETCDVVGCYCGVRLRPLSCPGGGIKVEKTEDGRWVAEDEKARRIERDCKVVVSAAGGVSASSCSKCLRSLYRVKEGSATVGVNNVSTASSVVKNNNNNDSKTRSNGNDGGEQHNRRDCELMALTWLLAKNRTLYLPTAIKVLYAFMMAPEGRDPLSCTLTRDGLPLAVDYDTTSSSSSSFVPSHYVRWILHCVSVLLLLLFA